MIKYLENIVMKWMESMSFYTPNSNLFADWLMLLVVLVFGYGLYFVVRKIVVFVVKKVSRRTPTAFDDILLVTKFFQRLSYLPSLILVSIFIDLLFATHPRTNHFLSIILSVTAVIIISSIIVAFMNALEKTQDLKATKQGSIRGVAQAVRTSVFIIAAVFILSLILGVKIGTLLTALGAASAVLMLVFKDSILGLVGGIQLSLNKMVLPGDWIEMPAAGADGNVIEISQITVKVQNWDNTIVTIPTYNLISQPVKNWRGMSEAGVRRIKRAIYLDMTSVKFCTDEMLARFRKIQYMADYIDRTQADIDAFNKTLNIDSHITEVNGRRQTNLGVFRAYLQRYLEHHPEVSHDFTLMARQLQPTDTGMPIEIYVFAKTTAWAKYETIQADIFDHIIASIPYFDLRVYQNPSWNDYKLMAGGITK